MMMHKAFHPRDDIDYMCQEKKEKVDLPTFQISMDTSIWGDIKKSKEWLIKVTRNSTDNIKINRTISMK